MAGHKMRMVHVLLSLKDDNFYIGFSENINKRVKEHNAGKVPRTINRRPLRLIFYEGYLAKTDAIRRERYFKTTKGKTTLKQIAGDSRAKGVET